MQMKYRGDKSNIQRTPQSLTRQYLLIKETYSLYLHEDQKYIFSQIHNIALPTDHLLQLY